MSVTKTRSTPTTRIAQWRSLSVMRTTTERNRLMSRMRHILSPSVRQVRKLPECSVRNTEQQHGQGYENTLES